MRKKILLSIAVIAVAITIAFNFVLNSSNNTQVDLFLANVEALANGEDIEDCEDGCCYPCNGSYCCDFLGKRLNKS
ncbi:MAG: NVEALA domain-containing protein [Bacteroidales bacterium]|jgi:peptidoglycan hydrolase CwlO-like protein|nr:NVEALA domain-containing protein [Bacteroidales bacterium]